MKTARKSPTDVAAYIAAFPPEVQGVLVRVRRIIRKALPRAVEAISYGIPAYEVDGRVVIYFAGWKAHYSLYPVGDRIVAEVGKELASDGSGRLGLSHTATSGKGTIRFPLSESVPSTLITAIVKARAKEAAAQATAPSGVKRRNARSRAVRA
jgi:uncharacterized protein YdhG (YjbR/CyaY superfamily)